MKEIVQLTKSEYDELQKKANYNQDEIAGLAKKMHEEERKFEIKLTIDCKQDYCDNIYFNAYSYMKEEGKLVKFSIPYDEREKIVEFVNRRMLSLMQKKFGSQITNINLWNKRFDLLRNWKLKFIGLTIFGWLAAFALLVVSFLR